MFSEHEKEQPILVTYVPSTPGLPVATHDGGVYMTVRWTEPENDGGADVTGYVIKYGDRFTDVDKYDELSVDGNTTVFRFTHELNECKYYRFAVAAVNVAGIGEFSEFTDDVHTWIGE